MSRVLLARGFWIALKLNKVIFNPFANGRFELENFLELSLINFSVGEPLTYLRLNTLNEFFA